MLLDQPPEAKPAENEEATAQPTDEAQPAETEGVAAPEHIDESKPAETEGEVVSTQVDEIEAERAAPDESGEPKPAETEEVQAVADTQDVPEQDPDAEPQNVAENNPVDIETQNVTQ